MELCNYAFVMRQGKVVDRGKHTPENHQKLVSMIMGASAPATASATAKTVQPEGD